jgi:hypothetical protein
MEVAFGYVGWTPATFWDSTWYEFSCAINGTKKYGLISAVAAMFGGKPDKPGASFTEAEVSHLKRELDAFNARPVPSAEVVYLRQVSKQLRRGRGS